MCEDSGQRGGMGGGLGTGVSSAWLEDSSAGVRYAGHLFLRVARMSSSWDLGKNACGAVVGRPAQPAASGIYPGPGGPWGQLASLTSM